MAHTYSVAALEAAHAAFRDLLDASASAANITIHDDGDVLLGTIVLDDPCGSVSAETGQLTFAVDVDEDAAPAGGTADYARFNNGDGDEELRLDCQAGLSPVSGYLVLTTLAIVEGAPIEVVSATIG